MKVAAWTCICMCAKSQLTVNSCKKVPSAPTPLKSPLKRRPRAMEWSTSRIVASCAGLSGLGQNALQRQHSKKTAQWQARPHHPRHAHEPRGRAETVWPTLWLSVVSVLATWQI